MPRSDADRCRQAAQDTRTYRIRIERIGCRRKYPDASSVKCQCVRSFSAGVRERPVRFGRPKSHEERRKESAIAYISLYRYSIAADFAHSGRNHGFDGQAESVYATPPREPRPAPRQPRKPQPPQLAPGSTFSTSSIQRCAPLIRFGVKPHTAAYGRKKILPRNGAGSIAVQSKVY